MVQPRWEVKIGSTVRATDDEVGRLQQLLVDPHQERVVAILVRPHALIPSQSVIVPAELIAEASENEVQLSIGRDQADALPKTRPDSELFVAGQNYATNDDWIAFRRKEEVGMGHRPESSGLHTISYPLTGMDHTPWGFRVHAGQQVFCRNGYAGRVSLVLLAPGGWVKGFVLRPAPLPRTGGDRIVPEAWIQAADRGNLHLSVRKQDLETLPAYGTDAALAASVDKALRSDEILRSTDYSDIRVSVQDGITRLQGHVTTPLNKARAEEAALSVAGVLGLENSLVVDQNLVIDVAQALGSNNHTRFKRISIGAQHGVITLNGQVASAATRDAAGVLAASVEHVRGVINCLRVPNRATDPDELLVRQPPIGGEVYATDMLLGQVESVIINPRNRRVTAFFARGTFPDPQNKDDQRLPDDDLLPERRIAIPITAVRHETSSSVLLKVSGVEAAQHRDVDPADFLYPPAAWQPPFPYRWEEVLFAREGWMAPIGKSPINSNKK
jgi:osmotically-inducible protein OsmY/sporulation protein YlmC with PRC-barrel domain